MIISSKFDELGHEEITLAMPYIQDFTYTLKHKNIDLNSSNIDSEGKQQAVDNFLHSISKHCETEEVCRKVMVLLTGSDTTPAQPSPITFDWVEVDHIPRVQTCFNKIYLSLNRDIYPCNSKEERMDLDVKLLLDHAGVFSTA